MRFFLTTLFAVIIVNCEAQVDRNIKLKNYSAEKKLIIKSNLLNLLAKRPTISVEKILPNNLGTEFCFVQGQFNNVLFADKYVYNGFLFRLKKYNDDVLIGNTNLFAGAYLGNLKRTIEDEGRVDNSGWASVGARYFSANSIRAGLNTGFTTYFLKNKLVIEGLGGLGYGRYIDFDRSDPNTITGGYLDMQIWLSIGYCF